MVLFRSPHPDVEGTLPHIFVFRDNAAMSDTWVHGIVPEDITTWEWVFENAKYSPLYGKEDRLASYINAVTKERLDWAQVKTKATLLSTALIREYGFQVGDTVSLFSTNTIWYPIAMWAVIRGGKFRGGRESLKRSPCLPASLPLSRFPFRPPSARRTDFVTARWPSQRRVAGV
jgi:hypothetical protein